MTGSTISSTSAAITAPPASIAPPGPKPSRPGLRSPAWPLGHKPSCDRPLCAVSPPEPIKLTVPGSARTTPRVRAELQASQEATRVLAVRYGLNPKTVTKGRQRTSTADQPMGPTRPRSTTLTVAEEAIIVEFRRRTLSPLDVVLGCLRESIPTLTRSALH